MRIILSICGLWTALAVAQAQSKILHFETQFKYAPVRISAVGDSAAIAKELAPLLPWIEHFSNYYQSNGPFDSLIYKANLGDTLQLDSSSYQLLKFGQQMYTLTEGELDVGIGNLLRAWGIGWGQKSRVPSAKELDSLTLELKTFPYDTLAANRIVIRSPHRHIAMGSYLEARILQEISRRLRQAQAQSWLIEVGGDFSFQGRKPDGKAWVLGIKDPTDPNSPIATIRLDNPKMSGFSTSGSYEQKFKDPNGQIHHHIFDPKTGQSSIGIRAVSVLSADPMINDALDTYFMLIPIDQIHNALHKTHGMAEAIVFHDNGDVWVSPGIRSSIQFLKEVRLRPDSSLVQN